MVLEPLKVVDANWFLQLVFNAFALLHSFDGRFCMCHQKQQI